MKKGIFKKSSNVDWVEVRMKRRFEVRAGRKEKKSIKKKMSDLCEQVMT